MKEKSRTKKKCDKKDDIADKMKTDRIGIIIFQQKKTFMTFENNYIYKDYKYFNHQDAEKSPVFTYRNMRLQKIKNQKGDE